MRATSSCPAALSRIAVPVRPWTLSGVVYGALLNHRSVLEALGDSVRQPPYKAPPQAPVLQVKPRNCLAGEGEAVGVPAGAEGVEIGASLAIVVGRTACRVDAADAFDHITGYLVAADLSLPAAGHYRPAVRLRARDGFCPLGPRVVPAAEVAAPDALAVRIEVDGRLAQATDTAGRVRGVAKLLADVTEFMTLHPGDVLLLGASQGAPRAAAGSVVRVAVEGVGALSFRLVAEGDA